MEEKDFITSSNINIEHGEFLFLQGEASDCFYILHSGKLEVLVNNNVAGPLTKEKVISNGKRIALIETKSTVGELGCLKNQPRNASVRAIEKSVVTRVPTSRKEMLEFLTEHPAIAIFISKVLLWRLIEGETRFNDINAFLVNLQKLIDNISIISKYFLDKIKNDIPADKKKLLLSFLQNLIIRRGETLSEKLLNINHPINNFDISLIEQHLTEPLNIKYGVTLDNREILPDLRLIGVLHKAFSIENADFEQYLLEENKNLIYLIFLFSDGFAAIDKKLYDISLLTDKSLNLFAGNSNSCLKTILDIYDVSTKINSPLKNDIALLLDNLFSLEENLIDEFQQLWGKDISGLIIKTPTIYKAIQDNLITEAVPEKEENSIIDEPEEIEAKPVADIPDIDPLKKIIELGIISGEEEENILKRLDEYKNLPERTDTESTTRSLKKNISAQYWNVIYNVWKYCYENKTVPLDFKYLFRYGLLDLSLVSEKVLVELPEPKSEKSKKIPIFYLDEWIEYIFTSKEPPSKTELGLNYTEYLEEQKSSLRRGEKLDIHPFHTAEFEINNMIKSSSRMCSGSLGLDFPILDEVYLRSDNLKKSMLNKDLVERNLRALLGIDYSMFYRDVRYVIDGRSQYYYAEVFPNIIILPVVGSKGIVWQEVIGNKRNSRGRIIFPSFTLEDFGNMLLNTAAHFRWELAKTMAGYSWGDPVEGELTGKYYDYVQFYKKNNNLSQEVKEQLKILFTKYRSVQERFAYDYNMWIKYEREGIIKLNTVNREIFYNYVPFPKPIRSRLTNMPAFEKIARVAENRRIKEIKTLNNRKKRYAKEGKDISKIIATTIKFYET